jgi:anti-anti-sigma factor
VQQIASGSGNWTLALSEEIDMATSEAVRSMLQPYIEIGGPVILDLSAVSFMDSTGIHVLMDAAEALGDRGCIIVHGIHGSVAQLFEITRSRWAGANIHVIGCSVLAATG